MNAIAIFNRNYNTSTEADEAANVYISDGEITGCTTSASTAIGTNHIRSGSSNLTITGGTITGRTACIYWPSAGTLTIGSIDSNSDESPYLTSFYGSGIIICCGTLNVYSGTIESTYAATSSTPFSSTTWNYNYRYSSNAYTGMADAVTVVANRSSGYVDFSLTVNLAGGIYKSSSNYAVRYLDCNTASDTDTDTSQEVSVSISGGTYTGGTTTSGDAVAAIDESCVAEKNQGIISGGTYSSDISAYTTSTSAAVATTDEDGNTVYEVVATVENAVALVYNADGNYASYTSLSDAFAAATDGCTIVLADDVDVSESTKSDNGLYQVSVDVTLNLNEKTLTITNKRAFGVLTSESSLTIENGTIAYVASGDTTLVITRNGASFSAESVTFEAIDDVDESTTTTSQYLVYAAAGGSVMLTDCTISNVSNAVVKDNANSATVYMKGCSFGDVTAVSGTNYANGNYQIYIDIDSTNSISGSDVVKVEGGYIYTVNDGGSISANTTLYVKDCGQLVLEGGTLSGSIVIRDGGVLEVQSGTVNDTIAVEKGGKLTVSDGEVKNTITNAGYTSITGGTVTAIKLQTNTSSEVATADDDTEPDYTVEISGGTVNSNITVASGTVLNLSGDGTVNGTITTAGTLNMTGGTVSATGLNSDNGAIHVTAGTINISGGTVTAEGAKARAISTANSAALTSATISGGTFTGSNLALLVQTGTTGLTVTGGTFITSSSGLASIIDRAGAITVGVYDMSGDVITKDSSNYYNSTVGDYTVFVGTFPYKMTVTTTDGTITGYSSLANALKAANSLNGSTVKMFTNAGYSTSYWTVSGTVTIDLNGHTITSAPTSSSYGTLYVTGSLTLKDSAGGGYVKNTSSSIYGNAVKVYNNASFTMEGGTVTGKFGIYGSKGSTITLTGGTVIGTSTYALQSFGGTVIISGDEKVTITNSKTSNTAYGIYFANNAGGSLEISNENTYVSAKTAAISRSSSYTITSNVKAGYYSSDVTNYVGDGYECVTYDDSTYGYIVQKVSDETAKAIVTTADGTLVSSHATLLQAVEAAEDGQIVVLKESMSGEGIDLDTSEKSITIDLGGYEYKVTSAVGSTGTVTSGWRFLAGGSVTIKNGTLTPASGSIAILIQNYCNLTLEDVTLGTYNGSFYQYGISCINGSVTLNNTTINKSSGGYAIRVYYWNGSYPDGVTVTVNDGCVINGSTLYTNNGTDADAENVAEKAKLIIKGGEFYGSIVTSNLNTSGDTGIEISGGHFAYEVLSDYCAEGYAPYKETEGDYVTTKTIPYTVSFILGISSNSSTEVPAAVADGYGESVMYVKVSGSYLAWTDTIPHRLILPRA